LTDASPLLRGGISLGDVLEDVDITGELGFPGKRNEFWLYLCAQRQQSPKPKT